jgi:hypothetical protein
MPANRKWQQIVINWANGATDSSQVFLGGGCFGTLIVPLSLNGATLQVKTDLNDSAFVTGTGSGITTKADFTGVSLLSSTKTLATGANSFTTDEIRQIGAAGPVKFVLNSAVGSATQAVLWWKD